MSREVKRPRALQQPEDVAPAAVVVAQPDIHPAVAAPPAGAGEVEADVAHRPDERVELEQRPLLLERAREVLGPVRRAETAPGDEVGVRRDRRRGIDLQQRQPLDDREQVASGAARRAAARAPRSAAPASSSAGARAGGYLRRIRTRPAPRTGCGETSLRPILGTAKERTEPMFKTIVWATDGSELADSRPRFRAGAGPAGRLQDRRRARERADARSLQRLPGPRGRARAGGEDREADQGASRASGSTRRTRFAATTRAWRPSSPRPRSTSTRI